MERGAVIVAGFGFRAAATLDSLYSALRLAGADHEITALAAPADKAGAECLIALGAQLNLPVRAVSPTAISQADTVTQSYRVQTLRATGSIAEAAALAAAGPGARLITTRRISSDRLATCALAIGDQT